MSDTPDTLSAQLSRKVAAFLSATGLAHKALARMIGCDRSQLTSYLSTGRGLSAERSLRLMQVLNCSRAQLERKFGGKAGGSQIVSLQERGKPMKLDSGGGWVAGQSGSDPNNSTSISNTWKEGGEPSGDDLIDVLRQIDNIHAEACKAIADYINKATQAKINRAGSTEPARRITDNTRSQTPGPKPDQFRITSRQHLDFLQRQRQKAEEELQIQKQILAERKKDLAARIELAKVEKQTVFD